MGDALNSRGRRRLSSLELAISAIMLFFIGAFALWAILGELGLGVWLLPALIILIVGYMAYHLYEANFPLQVSQVMVATPSRKVIYNKGGHPTIEEEKKFRLDRVHQAKVDLKKYIHSKSNRNVLITGSSGQGKSKLTRHLLSEMDYQKVIFSFKAGEEYLKMGYSTRNVSKTLPDPFSNSETFINAFVVAFPLGSIGIQASLVPTILEKLVKKSRSWPEFNKVLEKEARIIKDTNTKSALSFIKAHSSRLAYDTGGFSIANETVVLDFSALNEDAKSFYAELVLRQLYNDMEHRKRKDVLICVDEAHRLTTGDFGRYHTIIVEMSREIRDKGMLWITTQNYADIPDSIRNQFASQFIFKTTGHNDMTALKAIEPLLAWTISSLPKHYFVDAQFQDIHTHIPAFYYNPQGEQNLTATVDETTIASVATLPKEAEDRPTATQFSAMMAIYENDGAKLIKLVKTLKTQGSIKSDLAIYGAKGRKGIFESLVSLGLANNLDGCYKLTKKGLDWIDVEKMMERVRNVGSDVHRRLMEKTIEYLHERNMLVIVPEEGDAPDLIAYPVDRSKKYLWDDKNRRAYEIQTTGRKDSVISNRERNIKLWLPTTWVNHDKEMLDAIKEHTENKDEYLLIKL